MRVKNIIILLVLFQIIVLSNTTLALETEDSHRDYCVRANNNLNFDIQVHPELNAVYVSFYNPNEENLSNLSFNVVIVKDDSNKIVSDIPINISVLRKNEMFCHLFEGIDYSYNEYLDLFFYNLKYKLGEREPSKHYALRFNNAFRIDKCIDINKWNRIEEIKYNGDMEIYDRIVFKKICSGAYNLNIGFKELRVPYPPVKEAKISYGNKEEELTQKHSSERGMITVVLDEKIPINETITVNLRYELYFNSETEEWKEMLLYPFSTFFYKFNTGNILPEKAYLTFDGNKIENIKDVGSYTVEILLPEGFTHEGKASESKYSKEVKGDVITTEDNSTFGIVHPSFSCLNVSSVPRSCLKIRVHLTPKAGSTHKKIIWASPVINGQPKKLSFNIIENSFYRFLWAVLLLISAGVVGIVIKYKKWYVPSIFGCAAVYVSFKSFLPIPPFVTLFDIVISFSIIAILILSLRNKEKAKRYFCTKCKRHHNLGKRLYNEHLKYRKK